MYDIQSLLGQVVTVRSVNGDEYVAKLLGVDSDNNYITVSEPRVVIINSNEVSLLPFAITAPTASVTLRIDVVFSVLKTFEETAEEYLKVVDSDSIEE